MLAKGCTIDVILPGKKGAKGFDLRLAQTRQFANFQNPIALQLFGSSLVLCVTEVQAVRKPLAGESGNESAFADALRTIENQHGIEFDARIKHTANGGTERLSGNCADVFVVPGTEVVDQQSIYARHTVPRRQGFDIFPDRVIGTVVTNLGDSNLIIALGECAVMGVNIADQLSIIGIAPVF